MPSAMTALAYRRPKSAVSGLMELSRQRLRPSLSEGSHITCPRCNGVGVIRDTESCAIQVLRILQEEAMKEGTGSVRAQVPVDVATFLLNENATTSPNSKHGTVSHRAGAEYQPGNAALSH